MLWGGLNIAWEQTYIGKTEHLFVFTCKHRASEGVFYIGDHGFVCQIIEPVTFASCAFIIIALQNIALRGYLDTRRNINFRVFMARRTV